MRGGRRRRARSRRRGGAPREGRRAAGRARARPLPRELVARVEQIVDRVPDAHDPLRPLLRRPHRLGVVAARLVPPLEVVDARQLLLLCLAVRHVGRRQPQLLELRCELPEVLLLAPRLVDLAALLRELGLLVVAHVGDKALRGAAHPDHLHVVRSTRDAAPLLKELDDPRLEVCLPLREDRRRQQVALVEDHDRLALLVDHDVS
mmetsp:Transcript_13674/g.42525  ORF Transcript_13674/g.42525 Transcript_13674/m.42525 type:complete len:205 (-) Transcript_13674:791-1405(-)